MSVMDAVFAEVLAVAGDDSMLYEGIEDPRVVAILKKKVADDSLSRATLVRAALLRKAATRATPRRATYVYFIAAEATGLIKIGSASDPESRLRSLQTGSPDRLTLVAAIWAEDAPAAERDLHRQFAGARMRGEWFHPTPELLSLIESIGGVR